MLMYLASLLLATACSGHSSVHDAEHEYGKPLWNVTYTDMLKRDLLATYDKFARPNHHTNATKVSLDLDLKHIDLDDAKSLFTVNAWTRLTWNDEKLQWNASEYGGLSVLHLADHEIWEPDIVLYNSALGNNIDHYGNTHCLAYASGTVLWVPPTQFAIFCDLDLTKWPFDQHTCSLRLGSWTYNGEQVDLQLTQEAQQESKVEIDAKVEWEVVSVRKHRHTTYYSCCPEPYIDLEFSITVERRSAAYRAIVLIPTFCTVLLTLTSLWLPAKDRFFMTALTTLVTTLFLVYFSIRVPVVGPHTPLIVLFFAYTLMMVTSSIVITVIFHNLSNSQIQLPRIVVSVLRGPLSTILLLPTAKAKHSYAQQHGYEEETSGGAEELREYESEQEERRILNNRGTQEGWVLVSSAVDRLVFTAYVIIFLSFVLRAFL